MGDDLTCGSIRYAEDSLQCYPEELMCPSELGQGSSGTLRLPLSTPDQATAFLEGLGGDAVGAGHAMSRIGINAPAVRAQYKQRAEAMVAEIARRMEAGEPVANVARWASAERNSIIGDIRKMTGRATQPLYTIRDWREYGWGGRT